jgi:hypothetical protein
MKAREIEILVLPNGRLRYFLEPMARQLGIRFKVSRRLPALDEARSTFERMM